LLAQLLLTGAMFPLNYRSFCGCRIWRKSDARDRWSGRTDSRTDGRGATLNAVF